MHEGSTQGEFANFEPMLWRTLGALARHGFAATPSDAQDIIHDFYLDAWQGVNARFDEGLGSFPTYVTSAFYRFARRRITGLNSWRQRLVNREELSDLASEAPTPVDALEQKQQLATISVALARLPSPERQVLHSFLSDSDTSERTIAAKHSISRYEMRELLLNALGRLCVTIGKIEPTQPEALVAFYLWHDERSPKNVSVLVGLPISEIHQLKAKFAANLLASIRSSPAKPQQGLKMPSLSSPDTPPLDLLKRALLAIGLDDALTTIRSHAVAIREALDGDSDMEFSRDEARLLETNPEWLAQVYDAIGAVDRLSESDIALELALDKILSKDYRDIGEAFAGLLRSLPGEFKLWKQQFAFAPVEAEMQRYLEDDPSFIAFSHEHIPLTMLGLTPVMFQAAAFSLESLFDRLLRQDEMPSQQLEPNCDLPPIALSEGQRQIQVGSAIIVAQVRTTPGLRPDAAPSLTRWLFSATEFRPQLIRGFNIIPNEKIVECKRILGTQDRCSDYSDLFLRWCSNETARAEPIDTPCWSITRQTVQSADTQAP